MVNKNFNNRVSLIGLNGIFFKKRYFSKKTEDLKNRDYLLSLGVKDLRNIAKNHNISLKNLYKKADIVTLIYTHFYLVDNEELPVISTKFEVEVDEFKRINIARWFIGRWGQQSLNRFLGSKDFNRMKRQICKNEVLMETEIINNRDRTNVFVHLHLALLAASSLSDDLFYSIYNYYLNTRVNEIEKTFLNQIQKLETKLLVKEFGAKINKVDWKLFKLPYALYVIKIMDVYKIGAVGINSENSCKERLDNRLVSHRSTYAKFELITVIYFTDSQSVTLFEQVTKLALRCYSIGRDTDTRLEQYSFKDTDICINSLILKQFDALNLEYENLGVICSKQSIEDYNKRVELNLV